MDILEQLKRYSQTQADNIAYVSDNNSLTYGKLDEQSDKLAYYLQERLGDDKTPLVVYGHKSPLQLICFLACVKSGRAYCPIDISVPLSRAELIIKEIDAQIVLATEPLCLSLPQLADVSVITNAIAHTTQRIAATHYAQPDDIFYIIFTSGSTGTPKGVQISTSCLNHFIEWALTLGGMDSVHTHPTYINQAPFSFDLSVMDLYLSLASGGTLWTLSKDLQSDYLKLFDSLKRSNASVWVSTPSFVDICLSDGKFSELLLPQLSLFLFCGETLTNKTASKLQARFPKATIINTYGPTESTVAVTEVIITQELARTASPLPIGKAKPGTIIRIVDEKGFAVPDGEKGEIIIIGDTVSPGYFNAPLLTQASFFTENTCAGIQRGYRTGDEGYIKNHQLYYCGRMDLQIKLHGYRIEIEDIENNLLKAPNIRNAIVCPRYSDGKVKSLVAFVVTSDIIDHPFEASQALKNNLKKFIPEYMIPKKIIFVDSIPMTNNGKADRKKLGGILL